MIDALLTPVGVWFALLTIAGTLFLVGWRRIYNGRRGTLAKVASGSYIVTFILGLPTLFLIDPSIFWVFWGMAAFYVFVIAKSIGFWMSPFPRA